jgi:hypothetical protein
MKTFPLKSGTKQGVCSPALIQYSTGVPSQNNEIEERNKVIQIRKEEVKLSLFADDIILYQEDPKNSTKTLFNLINTVNKVAG